MPLKISKSHGSRFKLPPQPKPAKTDCWESVTYKSSRLPAPCFCSSSTNPHALAKCRVLHRRIPVVGFMCLLQPAYMNPTLWGAGYLKIVNYWRYMVGYIPIWDPSNRIVSPSNRWVSPINRPRLFTSKPNVPCWPTKWKTSFFSSVSPVFNQFSLVFTSSLFH